MEDLSWKIIVLGILLITSVIASFVTISRFVGSSDRWQEIQDPNNMGSIWAMSLIGSLLLFLAGVIYFRMGDHHEKIMYFIFALAFLALGLGGSAMGIALIYKN